jgi:hypothetical protein
MTACCVIIDPPLMRRFRAGIRCRFEETGHRGRLLLIAFGYRSALEQGG